MKQGFVGRNPGVQVKSFGDRIMLNDISNIVNQSNLDSSGRKEFNFPVQLVGS